MFDWLNNSWVVGIGGGILSGLLTAGISRIFLGKRENREYRQKVTVANREVIYAVRPGISEGSMPSVQVVTALTNATARRLGVAAHDMFTPAQLGEELIKEVMDSSFISATTKRQYCDELAQLLVPAAPSPDAALPRVETELTFSAYRERMIRYVSMAIGLMATVMTMTYSLLNLRPDRAVELPESVQVLLPALAASLALVVTMYGSRCAKLS